jgi:hypothetical protein
MTVESFPPQYSSVNDDLIWVVYDAHAASPGTYPNYKYVADLYINATLVFRSKTFQRPDNNRGVFNFGTIIREYVQAALQTEQGQGKFAIDVQVKFGEEYGGTTYTNIVTDSSRTYFNHYNGRYNDFTLLGAYANKPATTRPTTIKLFSANDVYYLPYFSTSTSSFNIVINGVTTGITPTVANTMQSIDIASGITSNHTIVLGGVTYNVEVICEPMYTNYPIHFLNKFGGWETMNFFKVSKKSYEVERKSWKQPAYRVDGSGVVSVKSGSIMHPQQSVFHSKFSEKLKVSTDILTDAEWQWLAQLVFSPMVYLQDGSTFYPVTIEESNYEERQYINDRLTSLQLTLSFGTSYKTQFQ